MSVQIDELAGAVLEELSTYQQSVTDHLKKEIQKTSRDCAAAIRKESPRETGVYAGGWAVKKAYERETDIRMVIFNKTEPNIAHLLERGHAKAGGGRVEGTPHIGPAEREAERQLGRRVKVIVRG